MILSAREIRAAVSRGAIGLTPLPEEPRRWSPTSVDLTLDAEIRPWEPIQEFTGTFPIDPMAENFNSNALIMQYTMQVDCTRGFVIKPHTLVLGWTIERLKLPHFSKIGARVEGKSSLARIGVGVHVTAPTIHPGFGVDEKKPSYPGSPIRLEIWNAGPLEIRLTKNMPICQILFEEVHGTPDEGYAGQFHLQGPTVQETGTPRRTRRKKRT